MTSNLDGCTSVSAPNQRRWSLTVMNQDEPSQFDIVSHSNICLGPYSNNRSTLLEPAIVQDIYRCVMESSINVEVLIARDSESGLVVGSALLIGQDSSLAHYFPGLGPGGSLTGILVNPSVDGSEVLSDILLMGMRRCRSLGIPSLECCLVRPPSVYRHLLPAACSVTGSGLTFEKISQGTMSISTSFCRGASKSWENFRHFIITVVT